MSMNSSGGGIEGGGRGFLLSDIASFFYDVKAWGVLSCIFFSLPDTVHTGFFGWRLLGLYHQICILGLFFLGSFSKMPGRQLLCGLRFVGSCLALISPW